MIRQSAVKNYFEIFRATQRAEFRLRRDADFRATRRQCQALFSLFFETSRLVNLVISGPTWARSRSSKKVPCGVSAVGMRIVGIRCRGVNSSIEVFCRIFEKDDSATFYPPRAGQKTGQTPGVEPVLLLEYTGR